MKKSNLSQGLLYALLFVFLILFFSLKFPEFKTDYSGESAFLFTEFTGAVILAIAFASIFFLPENCRKPEILFLILGLGGGTAFALTTPLCQECDGFTHLFRALDVSYGNLFSSFADLTHEKGVVQVPANLNDIHYEIFDSFNGARLSVYVNDLKNLRFSTETMLMEYSEGAFTFYYWPQALGLYIGRILRMSVYSTGILVHFLNLFTYLYFTCLAIRNMPVYRNLLMVLACSPLVLYQAASFSPDALLNSLCFLFTALCFRYAYREEKIRWDQVLILSVLLSVIFICKYVYACLGLLVFLIPVKKFGGLKKWLPELLMMAGLVGLVVFLSFFRVRGVLDVSEASMNSQEGITQLQYIRSHPKDSLILLLNTFKNHIFDYVYYSGLLGSLNYSVNVISVGVPAIFVAVAFTDTNRYSERFRTRDRVIFMVTAVVITVALMMAMYIFDSRLNTVGAKDINGIQGRYFFPFLILPFMALCPRVRNGVTNYSLKCAAAEGYMLLAAVFGYVEKMY